MKQTNLFIVLAIAVMILVITGCPPPPEPILPPDNLVAGDATLNSLTDLSQIEGIMFGVYECAGIQTAGDFSLDEISTYVE